MTPEETALARRLVELEGFVWEAGMLTDVGDGARLVDAFPFWWSNARQRFVEAIPGPSVRLNLESEIGGVPYLPDPAVGGILLARLGPGWSVMHDRNGYRVWGWGHDGFDREFRGPTLAVAAAKALVARGHYNPAPERGADERTET